MNDRGDCRAAPISGQNCSCPPLSDRHLLLLFDVQAEPDDVGFGATLVMDNLGEHPRFGHTVRRLASVTASIRGSIDSAIMEISRSAIRLLRA